jgi:predicted nucleic acid-binding protein
MPLSAVFLDAGPLGLVTDRPGKPEADACRTWVASLLGAGGEAFVPEISDYEVRRELLRAGKLSSVTRLDRFTQSATYLPISTDAMREAAQLWAQVRNAGLVTAPPLALDGDAILAGQVLAWCASEGVSLSDTITASVNVRHLARFVPSDAWESIQP